MSKESSKSTKGYKCLVFDTETTGIRDKRKFIVDPKWNEGMNPKKKKMANPDYGHIPHILQLSYILYDSEKPENPTIYNKYIDDILFNKKITITDRAKGIHNIDIELIKRCYDFHTDKKLPMEEESEEETKKLLETVSMERALEEFFHDIKDVQYIVGHNVQFDIDRLQEEIDRLKDGTKKTEYTNIIDNWSSYVRCTLEDNVDTCKLPKTTDQLDYEELQKERNPSYSPKYIYKVPKLSETYKHYFRYEPNAKKLHDAIMDVVLTLRVFLYGEFKVDVCRKNETIRDYLKKITPNDISLNEHGCSIQHQLFIKNSPEEKSIEKKTMKSRSKTKISRHSLDTPDVSEVTMNVDTSKRSKSRGGKRRKSKQTKKRRKKKSL